MKKFFAISLVAASATFGSVQIASAQAANGAQNINIAAAQLACEANPNACAARLQALLVQIQTAAANLPAAQRNRLLGQIATVATRIAQSNPSLRATLGSVVSQVASQSTDPVQVVALNNLVTVFNNPSASLESVALEAIAGSDS